MPRIPRVRALQSLRRASSCSAVPGRTPFATVRAISTTTPAHGLRDKLFKGGDAPGPEDPYTQRLEPEDATTNLPQEALQQTRRDRTPRALRETRLAMPPKRTEATTEKEVGAVDPNYTPATSLDDLVEIEPVDKWWDQPGHWGPESQFRGFGRAEKLVDREVVEVYLRRAVVEVLALKQAGKLSEWATKKWAEGPRVALNAALETPIVAEDGGAASLGGDGAAIVEQLTRENDEAEIPERVSLEEAQEMVKAWDSSWKDIVLDTEAKFAIRKRLYQLTGNLIPDARLGATRTVRHVLTMAYKQPKPKKLAEILEQQRFAELPNVRLHSKKIGPIDREIELGRWKVIKEELEKRNLPVTGTADLPGHKERKWARGVE